MLTFTCYILVVELVAWSHGNVRNDLEPTCYSRFDYDHKLMSALVTLETKVEQLQVVNRQETTIKVMETDLKGFYKVYKM